MKRVPVFMTAFKKRFDRSFVRIHRDILRDAQALDHRLTDFASLTVGTMTSGKRLRPLLVALGYEAVGGRRANDVLMAGMAVELFHSFALIHDDIIDRATQRRGALTIHESVRRTANNNHAGTATALLAGDLLFAYTDLFDRIPFPAARRDAARRAFFSMARETINGQQLEFDLSRQPHLVLDDIIRSMIYKSGRYSIEWPLTIGGILAGGKPRVLQEFSAFAIPVGIAFQLRDDMLGVFGDPRDTGKSNDSDLREGKHTLLIYFTHEFTDTPGRTLLARTLGNQHASRKDLARVRTLIRSTGAFARVEELMRELTDAGLDALAHSTFAPSAVKKLTLLARYLFDRNA